MSQSIDQNLVNAFNSNVELQFQQRGSRLRPFVRVEPLNSEFEYFDRIAPVDAIERTERHGDTPTVETPHSRRRIGSRDFEIADLIDHQDKLRMLYDPSSSYILNHVYALGRKMDDVIIEAFDSDVYTKKAGGTTLTFAQDGGETVTASSGLDIETLINVKEKLTDRDQIEDGEPLYMVVTAKQISNMLNEDKLTSSDYAAVKALVRGEIDTFMGFRFIRTQRLIKTGDIRACYAWARSGMCLGVADNVKTRMSERDDKSYSVQCYAKASFGATRMWGQQVVKVNCTES